MNTNASANTLVGRRILVGPADVAGFASRIAVALASGGADVRFFNGYDHRFNPHLAETANLRRWFTRSIGIATRWRERRGLARLAGEVLARAVKCAAFLRACCWAQTCVMVGGKGFFSGGIEYAFLRLLGKRVIHVFIGTASRPRYQSGYAKHVVKDGIVNAKELKRLASRTKRQARRINAISRNASVVIENPLCGHFHVRPFVNWFKLGMPLDATALAAKPRKTDATPPRVPGKVRVLHCPSRPEIKGSTRIQAVMEKLVAEGLPIEFRQITGVPHAQVLHEIAQCDFVVDELYSDSPLAGFAAEASAFGKASVVGGYGWKLFPAFLRPEEMPPTAACHPDDLESTVRTLVLDATRRMELGAKARAFLEAQWSEAAFAARFARIVTGDIPADWWMKPEDVRYLHGLGLEEGEVKRMIGAMVEQFGVESLQVGHVAELEKEFAAFGARGS